jgi:hypothetical protein
MRISGSCLQNVGEGTRESLDALRVSQGRSKASEAHQNEKMVTTLPPDHQCVEPGLRCRVARQRFGYMTPEEFEQLSTNGVRGKRQAEPKGGPCLTPPLRRVSRGGPRTS